MEASGQPAPFAPPSPVGEPAPTRPATPWGPLVVLTVCLTLLVFAGLAVWWAPAMIDRWAAAEAEARAVSDEKVLAGARESLTFRAVARKVMPSVVNVNARFPGQSVWYQDALFGRLYRKDIPGAAGQGSGVIVRFPVGPGPDAPVRTFVLTNHHVVTGKPREGGDPVPAESITVDVPGLDKALEAVIYGLDPGADLALLALPDESAAARLPPAELGDSDHVEVGDLVLAFGSPFGLQHTVTDGIISAKGRTGVVASDRVELLQTSAAVNPGNSGGPLADMAGRVIGINTAIVSRSGGSHGIGFAVPINVARTAITRFLQKAPDARDPVRIRRGWVGVDVVSLDRIPTETRRRYGLPDAGVLVREVKPGGPAAKAGVRPGDVVVAADGRPVADAGAFAKTVGAKAVGDALRLSILRPSGRVNLTVTIAEMPTPTAPAGDETETAPPGSGG